MILLVLNFIFPLKSSHAVETEQLICVLFSGRGQVSVTPWGVLSNPSGCCHVMMLLLLLSSCKCPDILTTALSLRYFPLLLCCSICVTWGTLPVDWIRYKHNQAGHWGREGEQLSWAFKALHSLQLWCDQGLKIFIKLEEGPFWSCRSQNLLTYYLDTLQ